MSDAVLTAVTGRGLHVTLNDPKGVSDAAARELTAIMLGAHERASYVVLRSSADDFCTGRNNPRPPADAPLPDALDRRRTYDVIFDLYGSFRSCRVPVVGVVRGRAMGLGFSLAALCDITLAAETATFQINEMNHRILPTMVMSSMVDRMAPKDLGYLVISRATISAQRAQQMSVVNEVVPPDQLDATVDALIATLEATPSIAIQSVKDYIRTAYDMPVAGAVDYARNIHAVVNAAPEMRAEPPR